ncbi:MAG: carboxypeptidase-like regulatory domain-containing protein [Chloroflexota bacterium]
MKIKRKFQVLVAICMVVILNWIPVQSVSSVVQAAAAKPVVVLQTSQIVLKAGSGNVNAAASIVIPVTLDIPTGMTFGGALVDVQFNPSVLDATTCTADSSFTIGLCNPDYDHDAQNPDAVRFNVFSVQGKTGSNVHLGDITFLAIGIAAESSDLNVVVSIITDPQGLPVASTTLSGKVTINGATPPAVSSISGKVLDNSGVAVADVTISDNAGHTAKTNASGQYTLSNLAAGSYVLTPSTLLIGVVFDPPSLTVNVPPTATGKDFKMVPLGSTSSISGKVVDNGGLSVPDVTITDNVGHTTKTDANGNYTLASIPVGTYTITPSVGVIGVTFEPLNLVVSVPPAATNQNFKMVPLVSGSSISGKVTDNSGAPISDITITDNVGHTTKTNASGDYSLSGLSAGTYTLTPSTSLLGVKFDPATLSVTVPPSATGKNFKLVPLTGCNNIIKNGDFESDTDWYLPATKYTAGYDPNIVMLSTAAYSTDEFHAGKRSLRTGIVDPKYNIYSYSSGWQQVSIPSSLTTAKLRFWAFPRSVNGVDASDSQLMLILNSNKQEIYRPLQMRSNERIWKQFEIDLKPLAGQTVWVYFGTYNNGLSATMAMYVDDVSLEVCP